MTMTPLALVLAEGERRIVARCRELGARIHGGDESAWPAYLETLTVAAALRPAIQPGANLLTTAQLSERLQLSPRTIRRKTKTGEFRPVRFGKNGRGAVRWRTDAGAGR